MAINKIKIHALKTELDGSISFDIIDEGTKKSYKTNKNAEGLWELQEDSRYELNGGYKQIIGTSQFSLHQKTDSGKRKAIKRFFDE